MHFIVNEHDYFDLEIDEQCFKATPDRFDDYKNVIEITFDFTLEKYGWGCGGGWYISRKDIRNMAEALKDLCNGDIATFDYHCKHVMKGHKTSDYYHLVLNKVLDDVFHSNFSIVEDLETLEIEVDFTLEALKKDAALWQEYAEKYPIL